MTDDLRTMLHDEAGTLLVSDAPAGEILGAGRALRRRRRATVGAATAAVLVAAGVGITMIHEKPDTRFEPADAGVLAGTTPTLLGNTVHLGGNTQVTLPGQPTTLLYTSAGLVVPTAANIHGAPPYHLTVVSPDGQARRLAVTVDAFVVASDPGTPYVAWVNHTTQGLVVMVHDVVTDRDVAQVSLHGSYSSPIREQRRLWLDGATVYVAADGGGYAVDWRTGQVRAEPTLDWRRVVGVRGGHLVDARARRVVDAGTGRVLLRYESSRGATPYLSPDGRYLEVAGPQDDGTTYVYDVDTGRKVALSVQSDYWGWTPDGRAATIVDNGDRPLRTSLVVCDPVSGHCDSSPYPYPAQLVRQGVHGFLEQVGMRD